MTVYYAFFDRTRVALDLASEPLGRGAEADVFRVRNRSGEAAKIYHRREGVVHADRAKLEAMIASPPEHLTAKVEGVSLVQFAWPTHIVEDEKGECAGFLMPEVPLDRAVTFEAFMSRDSLQQALLAEDRSLPRRVTICRNLAAALAELHRQHHYFVDIKPQNIYLFKNTGIVCLVDTDSFAISGRDGSRFPASVYSAEYIAPELLRDDVPARRVQDDRQDCYALAVLMFRILDNGFHPFQGIPAADTDTSEWNIDHSVLKGYYPHGREPNPASTRPVSSTSDLWDAGTRALFDRAFGSRQPGVRPSAAEWRDHFDSLLQRSGAFVKCGRVSGDVLHIHFADTDCPECRLEAIDSSYEDSAPQPSIAQTWEPQPSQPSPPAQPALGVPTNAANQAGASRHRYANLLGAGALLALLLIILAGLGVFTSHSGDDYFYGRNGVPQNDTEALQRYKKEASAGNPAGQAGLAFMLSTGRGGANRDDKEALGLYFSAASKGNARAQLELAMKYEFGRAGLSKDDVQAAALFRKLADLGNAQARTRLGSMYSDGRGGLSVDDARALALYQQAADQGDPEAQVSLGNAYSSGRGVTRDDAKALALFRMASNQGYPDAHCEIGAMYAWGRGGLAKDDVQALAWLRKAAEQGSAWGEFNLGHMYAEGRGGLAKDQEQALAHFQKAAAQGDREALTNLGEVYLAGLVVAKDDAKALALLRMASDQGDAGAHRLIGYMYETGRGGLAKSDTRALVWYKKAAEQGDATGQFGLGLFHELGRGGLVRNPSEAVRWYQKSADQDDTWGEFSLGYMYERGVGVKRDLDMARELYRKAALQGNDDAKARLRRLE